MMAMDYDVIVAGAGPGGSTAAYELARRGVRVGVFEKQQFPRVKPCGGCLSLKIDHLLAPDFHALVERTIHGVRLTFEGLRPVHRRSDRPVAYLVMHDRFDLKGAAAWHVVNTFWPFGKSPRDLVQHYDRLAPHYDRHLRLWRALIGSEAWEHLGTLLAAHVKEGAAVLDAGTGTGEVVKLLLERANPAEVIGVDLSKGMLRQAKKKLQDPRLTFSVADIRQLPYPDRRFDVAVCAWTLEALAEPRAVVEELLRVIKDDGYVIYVFASAPAEGIERFYATLVEWLWHDSLRWRLLTRDERPYHECPHSRLATFARGLSTVVVLRKCCTVAAPVLPCRLSMDAIA